jgi:uncharacterized protein with ParB-like and HNH nuclease domain
MARRPKPNATEYLRRVLGIPITRNVTGREDERIDFAAAALEFMIKDPPSRKQMADFIRNYTTGSSMSVKVCYATLKTLKDQTIVRFDEVFKVYHYNEERYNRDFSAIKAFHQQVKAWKSSSFK